MRTTDAFCAIRTVLTLSRPTRTGGGEVEQRARELPDAIRIPLDSLHADAGYLAGRAAIDGCVAPMVAEAIKKRVDEAKVAITAALTEAKQQGPGKAGWQRMTQEARAIQMRHVNKHDGDVYHAMQSLVIKHGFRSDVPLTQPITTQPPHQDRGEVVSQTIAALTKDAGCASAFVLNPQVVPLDVAIEAVEKIAALTEAKQQDRGDQSRALMLAADQLARLALECPHGSRIRYEACEWANIAHYAARAEAKQQGRTEPEVCPSCFWVNPKQQGLGEAVAYRVVGPDGTPCPAFGKWVDVGFWHSSPAIRPVLREGFRYEYAYAGAPQVEAKRQTGDGEAALVDLWRNRANDGYLTGKPEIDSVTKARQEVYFECADELYAVVTEARDRGR